VPRDEPCRFTFDDAVLHVEGDLDVTTRGRFGALAEEVRSDGSDLVIDLSQVSFVDSSTLTVLLRLRTAQRSAGHDLVLRRPSVTVTEILRLSGLDTVFTIDPAGQQGLPAR
jgi:anti-sigma B factor antagonist